MDDSDELAPLSKGELGPALPSEQNDVLEGLLRKGETKVTLSAQLSFGTGLSSSGKGDGDGNGAPETLRIGTQLSFKENGQLWKQQYLPQPQPTVETELHGVFEEPLLVTYGANRLLGRQNVEKSDLEDPIASRLSEVTELYDMEEILSSLDYAWRKRKESKKSDEYRHLTRLLEALAKILPENVTPTNFNIFPPDVLETLREPSGVHIDTFSGRVPFSALSLGYQTTLAWTTDLAWRMLKRYPKSSNPLAEPAIVLLDEIDLHLHPLWQLRILTDLSEIFGGTQFVATAHSPLIVQVAETANLLLLRKRDSDVEIVNDPEIIRSWRVDQILMSELFGVPRGRNKTTEELFSRRDELVDKPSLSAAQKAELANLRAKISQLPTAQHPDDQKAMDFVRQAAALIKKHKTDGR